MIWLRWLVLMLTAGVLCYAATGLPPMGEITAPAATHVSPRYIEKSHAETATPNFVTAILADYRGYDTLGETTVIVTAGLACVLILSVRMPRSGEDDLV
jgi:multicomponent Na+:H+ antiporter subunit B